jgi:hypothetical protein
VIGPVGKPPQNRHKTEKPPQNRCLLYTALHSKSARPSLIRRSSRRRNLLISSNLRNRIPPDPTLFVASSYAKKV